PVTMDAVRRFGDDDDFGARSLGHRDVVFRRLELLSRGPLEESGRIPAADENEPELGELVLERRAVDRHFVALLHADDARFLRLRQTGLERRVAADLLKVIVGPADGVGADAYGHVSLLRAGWSGRVRIRDGPRPLRDGWRRPVPRRPTRSRRRRSSGWDRCR